MDIRHVNSGYGIDHLLVFRLRPDNVGYQWPQSSAFFDRVIGALAATPGVKSAALTFYRPLTYEGGSSRYKIPGEASGFEPTTTSWTTGAWVSEAFFTTMGIPLVLGRGLRATDDFGAPKVAVVNEKFRPPIPARLKPDRSDDL